MTRIRGVKDLIKLTTFQWLMKKRILPPAVITTHPEVFILYLFAYLFIRVALSVAIASDYSHHMGFYTLLRESKSTKILTFSCHKAFVFLGCTANKKSEFK